MTMDKSRINRTVSMATLVVLGLFGLVLLLQLAARVFGPSKSACTKQVCLSKFLEGPPAFNNEALASYLQREYFTGPGTGQYQLSGVTGEDETSKQLLSFVKTYFKNKKNGIFVDLGAGDGEYRSLTLPLEKELGWTGLLVEPNPNLYEKILQKGRKAHAAKNCVSPYSYPAKMKMSFPKSQPSAGDNPVINQGQTKLNMLWEKEDKVEFEVFEAQCIPVENLIFAAGITYPIDLLVLDMSGTDLDVLLSAKFDQIPDFEMIVVHANGSNMGADIGGYFLERNMVIKKVFGSSADSASYVLIKFDAHRDL